METIADALPIAALALLAVLIRHAQEIRGSTHHGFPQAGVRLDDQTGRATMREGNADATSFAGAEVRRDGPVSDDLGATVWISVTGHPPLTIERCFIAPSAAERCAERRHTAVIRAAAHSRRS